MLSIFRSDTNRASVSLTRPSFDLNRWEKENFPWTDLPHHQVQLPAFYLRPVDSSLIDPGVRQTILDLRYCTAVLRYYRPLAERLDEFYLRLIYVSRANTGHLVIEYIDGGHPTSLASDGATYLACIYWLRRDNRCESLGFASRWAGTRSTVYDAGPKILHELRSIDASEEFGSDSRYVCNDTSCIGSGNTACSRPFHICSHAEDSTSRWRLWILYIGALIERAPHSRFMKLGNSFQRALYLRQE